MSFRATVFRVLIASPADVTAERDIAVRTIQEWNDLNAAEREIALLPLRWETHSSPEYGRRPQEAINRQVVDQCDLLVGIFWTRIGSPTGLADGGTVEEIERVARQGKPVMLYFSQLKESPEKLDLEQLSKLRDFKKKTLPNALVESYVDHVDFKEKLSKQIELQLRTLLAHAHAGRGSAVPLVSDIVLHLADPQTGADAGTEIVIERTNIELTTPEDIPDYAPAPAGGSRDGVARRLGSGIAGALSPITLHTANKHYYREKASSFIRRSFFVPIRFWLTNQGSLGARDVFLDLKIRSESGEPVHILPLNQLSGGEPERSTFGYGLIGEPSDYSLDEVLSDKEEEWTSAMDVGALQPQRAVTPTLEFAIGAKRSCTLIVDAQIFADTLPQPTTQRLTVRLHVRDVSISGREFFETFLKAE